MGKTTSLKTQLSALLLLFVTITQCSGEKTKSDEVEFKSRTDEPVVINGNISIGTGDQRVTIEAPWFIWQYSFRNDSDMRVVIPTAVFRYTTRRNGVRVEDEFTIDPGQFCSSSGTRAILAIVEKRDLASTLDEYSGALNCDPDTQANRMTPPDYERWFISDLGESDTGIYNVEIEVEGWFENDDGAIVERYQDFDFLITR